MMTQWQDRAEFDRAGLSIDVLNSSFEVCLKILVQVRTTGKQKMDIEGIPSFHMTAIEDRV